MIAVSQVTAVVHPPPRDGKRRDYCFVHFADHAVVQKLIADGASGNKPQLEGVALDVRAANLCSGHGKRVLLPTVPLAKSVGARLTADCAPYMR